MRVLAQLEIGAIRLYQAWRYGKPTVCRYQPRCDAYGVEALQVHGWFRANGMIIWRLLRCQPWGGFGYDPVEMPANRRAAQIDGGCSA